MSKEFNADMLSLARGARGMTQADVAQAANVTQALLSKVENKLVQPSEDVAERVAEALGFPVQFFYQEERALGFPHYHHRKRTSLGAKALAKIHAVLNIRRQHIAKLLRSYELEPDKKIPSFDLDEKQISASDAARMVREYWMLPRGPIDNLTVEIERAGGVVVQADFGTSLLDGISFRASGLPPIFVMNSEVPADRYRFSLAHELGHMVMHAIPGENDDAMEIQADEFASALLMPPIEIRPHLIPPTIEKFGRAKSFWKVSIKSMIRRAKDLRLISPDDYKRLSIQYSKAGYNRGEPYEIKKECPTLLHEMIKFHHEGLGYSFADLSTFLMISEDDFRKIYAPRKRLELVSSR